MKIDALANNVKVGFLKPERFTMQKGPYKRRY